MAFIDETGSGSDSHAEEDENYFISMTDMMVGILFIFIIMLMVFALNFKQQTDVSQQKIEQLKKTEQVAIQVQAELQELQNQVIEKIADLKTSAEARDKMLDTIRNQLAARGIQVEIYADSGVLRLNERAVRFDSSKSTLSDDAARNVDTIAQVLAEVLPKFTRCAEGVAQDCAISSSGAIETVFIEGHTDADGGPELNWPLSTQRAFVTYLRLIQSAPTLHLLRNFTGSEILSLSGYAATRPANLAATDEAKAANRRIDLRFVMEAENSDRLTGLMTMTAQMQSSLDELQSVIEANVQ